MSNKSKDQEMSYKVTDKEGYEDCLKYIGRIEAVILEINQFENIAPEDMTEEEYDENVFQASSLLFNAKQILENSAKRYLKRSKKYLEKS